MDNFKVTNSAPLQNIPKLHWLNKTRNTTLQAESDALYNQAVANWQWQNEVDLMNYQNAYNSPAEQMQRFKDAGLNPNLVYANGAEAGNMSGTPSAPTPNKAQYDPNAGAEQAINVLQTLAGVASTFAGIGSTFQQYKATAAGIRNTEAATKESLARGLREQLGLTKDQALYQFDVLTADTNAQIAMKNLERLGLENATYNERFELFKNQTNAQIDHVREQIRTSQELTPVQKQKALAEIANMEETKKNLIKQGKLYDWESKIKGKEYDWYDKKNRIELGSKIYGNPFTAAMFSTAGNHIPGLDSKEKAATAVDVGLGIGQHIKQGWNSYNSFMTNIEGEILDTANKAWKSLKHQIQNPKPMKYKQGMYRQARTQSYGIYTK